MSNGMFAANSEFYTRMHIRFFVRPHPTSRRVLLPPCSSRRASSYANREPQLCPKNANGFSSTRGSRFWMISSAKVSMSAGDREVEVKFWENCGNDKFVQQSGSKNTKTQVPTNHKLILGVLTSPLDPSELNATTKPTKF